VEIAIEPTEHGIKTEEGGILYGLIAEFDDAHRLVAAADRVRQAGYRRMDAYSPFPVEGLSESLGFRDVWIPFIMLIGGALGCLGGFYMIYWMVAVDYPLNIGGRPLYAWPSFLPITFECTVLLAALAGVIGMFFINGLPQPYHPVFDAPDFNRATSDRFFLCIEARDPKFDLEETRQFMESLGGIKVAEVELRK
jgi:hypothetical protein